MILSRPIGACGLKLLAYLSRPINRVAPHRGVWIETGILRFCETVFESRPIGACGLKPRKEWPWCSSFASRPIGACGLKLDSTCGAMFRKFLSRPIGACGLKQFDTSHLRDSLKHVAPHRGVWIETTKEEKEKIRQIRSRPIGACGLKHRRR